MKHFFISVLIIFFTIPNVVYAKKFGVKRNIDNDKKISLEEAIYALQVLAGTKDVTNAKEECINHDAAGYDAIYDEKFIDSFVSRGEQHIYDHCTFHTIDIFNKSEGYSVDEATCGAPGNYGCSADGVITPCYQGACLMHETSITDEPEGIPLDKFKFKHPTESLNNYSRIERVFVRVYKNQDNEEIIREESVIINIKGDKTYYSITNAPLETLKTTPEGEYEDLITFYDEHYYSKEESQPFYSSKPFYPKVKYYTYISMDRDKGRDGYIDENTELKEKAYYYFIEAYFDLDDLKDEETQEEITPPLMLEIESKYPSIYR